MGQIDDKTYKTQDFKCSECGWEGKGEELEYGEYHEASNIVDYECPECFHLVAFWQG